MLQITLAAARVNAGLNQSEAAELLDITPKTLRGYERGTTVIPPKTFKKAANIYRIPSDNIRLLNVKDGKFDEEEKNLELSTF